MLTRHRWFLQRGKIIARPVSSFGAGAFRHFAPVRTSRAWRIRARSESLSTRYARQQCPSGSFPSARSESAEAYADPGAVRDHTVLDGRIFLFPGADTQKDFAGLGR